MSAPTLFLQVCDANFAPQGLALYRSLQRHQTGHWRMVWIALGGLADTLRAWHVRADRPGPLEVVDYEAVVNDVPGLMDVLASRGGAPYFWTWASQATHWALENYRAATVAYLDTDCYAFADLAPAVAEVAAAQADVGLVSHRFPTHRAHMAGRAHFNVGALTTFRPTLRARVCAAAWAAYVRERCEVDDPGDAYLGIPPGRAGDQAFMDAVHLVANVHEIVDVGTGLAPYCWDGEEYLSLDGHPMIIREAMAEHAKRVAGLCRPPVVNLLEPVRLAHFHEARFDPTTGAVLKRTGYPIPADVERLLLAPYEAAVAAAARELAGVTT